MNLEQSLAKLKEKIEGNMPPENVAIIHQATKALVDSGMEERILKAGDKAPAFTLQNHEGVEVSSQDLLEKGGLVITFYRGIWCPYCNADLTNLKRYKDKLEEEGLTLLGIAPQTTQFSQKAAERFRLNFDLLRDEGNELAAQFGLRWEMVDPLKALYDRVFNIHLPNFNGEDSWSLPVPARFIVAQDGSIQYAEYSIDYTKRPNPDVLLEALA